MTGKRATILITDDELAIIRLLKRRLTVRVMSVLRRAVPNSRGSSPGK